ncbi:hypothetical protein ADL00_02420 [Streptomyces sp. AS58]|uniref:hypothetical protein n=1 Tax=Streptomyces sp. AS58 TaxID=1519489 RepID=UPI0006AFAD34|nr:hypothetical protein [Streptomyces sp. AS58]KOV74337.1 hypothetical protein ADL00_02420 [Streptomyces sp. AS58]
MSPAKEPDHAEQILTAAGCRLRARESTFDVATGLHRLARDAGYLPEPAVLPWASRALHDLEVFVTWSLDQPGAATHVEQLASVIGEPDAPHRLLTRDQDTECLDLDGAHVFACMLYLADHPESAQFWWRLTAGAGNCASAICLYLLHHGRGESAEADHWHQVLLHLINIDDDPAVEKLFVGTVGTFAAYIRRNRPPAPVTPALNAEVRRLADRDDTDVLVVRPDPGLARRLQDCTR